MDVEEIAAVTGLWHTNVEDALRTGLEKMAADPELASIWRDLVNSDRGHALARAQLFAEPDDEAKIGRPPYRYDSKP
jgi:hypothetical protein